jgi:cardiolipin synthase
MKRNGTVRVAHVALGFVLAAFAAASCGGSSATVPGSDVDAATPDDGSSLEAGALDPDGGAPGDAAIARDGSSPPRVDAGAPPDASAGVTIIVEPGDNASGLLAAVKGATKSVHMTMYLLTNTAMIQALIDASKRPGVDVKVVLNESFPGATPTTPDPQNAAVFQKLKTAGVNVVYAPPAFTFTHEKCVIVDGKVAWIMTMNSTQTSARDNREYLAVDTDPADVVEAEQIFQGDFTNVATTFSGNLVVAPVNARDRLLALIASATKRIDVEGETFSDTKVAAALAAAAKSGIPVRLVVSTESPTAAQTQAIATVKASGAKVVATDVPTIHSKAIVVDGARAYVGSANFTTNSLMYNRELGVIIDTASEVGKVAAAVATDFTQGTAQ